MSVKVQYKSNTANFINLFNKNKAASYEAMGVYGVSIIKGETPVLSGDLKASIQYKAESGSLFFYSDLIYAYYVEFGTFIMSANPFMKRGLVKSNTGFLSILIKNLKV